METQEVETLLSVAEGNDKLNVRRGVMDRLHSVDAEALEPGQKHRLNKLRHCVKRDLDMALRTQE